MSAHPERPALAGVDGQASVVARRHYDEVKASLHWELLNRLDLVRLAAVTRAEAEPEIRRLVGQLLAEDLAPVVLSRIEREALVLDVLNEIFGLGPLEGFLADPRVSDILVNRFDQVYVEREGVLEPTAVSFMDDGHLMRIIERVVSAVGRRVDEASPMVDARLPDGSRVNVIIPPLALDGPALSIRRFQTGRLSAQDLVRRTTLTQSMLDFLAAAVGGRLNIIVSGGTGSGKTTLLNALSEFISARERIITVEDAAELRLQQRHVVRLETRRPNVEGQGGIHQRQLLINALRMRPDRIIVGEVRGDEAVEMLQAMNTGHDGSLSTVHANSPRDALHRFDTMFAMSGLNMPVRAIRQQIASAVNLLIHITRLSDGIRRVTAIAEVTDVQDDIIGLHDLFVFERHGVGDDGRVRGRFRATGNRPFCIERLESSGFQFDPRMFDRVEDVR